MSHRRRLRIESSTLARHEIIDEIATRDERRPSAPTSKALTARQRAEAIARRHRREAIDADKAATRQMTRHAYRHVTAFELAVSRLQMRRFKLS